jgi:urease accessory protein
MISRLHIKCAMKDDMTRLQKAYCTPPFKIADIREDKRDPALILMLMTSSPGIMEGDDHHMEIEMDAGSQLSLHTQSYQRLFEMRKGASQQLTIRMADHCHFSYIPHPVVPHKNASFTSVNRIYMADGCTLTWAEVLTCGRKLNGEEFLFSKYHSRTEIFQNNKLVIKENLLVRPGEDDIHAMGNMEGYTHQASFIFLDARAQENRLTQSILAHLAKQEGIAAGLTRTSCPGFLVRILGSGAEQLFTILQGLDRLISKMLKEVRA